MNLRDYNIDTPEDKLIEACQRVEDAASTSEGKQLYLGYLLGLLNLKKQKELLEAQNKFNKELLSDNEKLIKTNRKLVKATWTLAIATIILAIATVVFAIVK